jgi:hypothetical protein
MFNRRDIHTCILARLATTRVDLIRTDGVIGVLKKLYLHQIQFTPNRPYKGPACACIFSRRALAVGRLIHARGSVVPAPFDRNPACRISSISIFAFSPLVFGKSTRGPKPISLNRTRVSLCPQTFRYLQQNPLFSIATKARRFVYKK